MVDWAMGIWRCATAWNFANTPPLHGKHKKYFSNMDNRSTVRTTRAVEINFFFVVEIVTSFNSRTVLKKVEYYISQIIMRNTFRKYQWDHLNRWYYLSDKPKVQSTCTFPILTKKSMKTNIYGHSSWVIERNRLYTCLLLKKFKYNRNIN